MRPITVEESGGHLPYLPFDDKEPAVPRKREPPAPTHGEVAAAIVLEHRRGFDGWPRGVAYIDEFCDPLVDRVGHLLPAPFRHLGRRRQFEYLAGALSAARDKETTAYRQQVGAYYEGEPTHDEEIEQ